MTRRMSISIPRNMKPKERAKYSLRDSRPIKGMYAMVDPVKWAWKWEVNKRNGRVLGHGSSYSELVTLHFDRKHVKLQIPRPQHSWLQILLKVFDKFTSNRILRQIYNTFLYSANGHRFLVHRHK